MSNRFWIDGQLNDAPAFTEMRIDEEDEDDMFAAMVDLMNEKDAEDAALQEAAEAAEYGDMMITAGKRVRPEFMKYAKVAKRVDVKRLKSNLWKDLVDQTDVPFLPKNVY